MGFFEVVAPFYDTFMRLIGNEKNHKIILERIVPLHHRVVLDVGGGTGSLAAKMSAKENQVYIVDTSNRMLELAREKGLPEENLIIADAANLPFEREEFDLIICSDALHHFSKKEKSLKEMARVLKEGGELIILEFDYRSTVTKLLKVIEKIFREPSEFYKPSSLKKELELIGIKGKIENLNRWQFLFHGKKAFLS